MTVLRIKNQSDYAFQIWMNSFPNSTHPLDKERFLVFAKTVARYRNKKWLNYEHFENSIKLHPSHFDENKIESYFARLADYVEFYKVDPIPSVTVVDGIERFQQVGVIKDKIYQVTISREEYDKGGASAATLKNAKTLD
ncbi:MAG: hypothetical protein WAS27_01660 [Candidatus Saccharimonadales bacterium]